MNYISDLINMIGGGKFTDTECKEWLKNKKVNPQSSRKIGPTKSGRGVYHDLEQACLEKGYIAAKPGPIRVAPVRTTPKGTAIVRTTKGRKAPAISATSVEEGTEALGQDGKTMYIISVRSDGTHYWQPCAQKTANCKN